MSIWAIQITLRQLTCTHRGQVDEAVQLRKVEVLFEVVGEELHGVVARLQHQAQVLAAQLPVLLCRRSRHDHVKTLLEDYAAFRCRRLRIAQPLYMLRDAFMDAANGKAASATFRSARRRGTHLCSCPPR